MILKITKYFTVLASILFFSCEVEPIDPQLLNQVNTNNPNNPNNPVVADYWPAAINNSWTYNQNGTPQTPMKIISTEVSNGATYYNFDNFFGQTAAISANVNLKLRKNQGSYYMKLPSFTVDYGGGLTAQASEVEYLLFKDFVNVNDTWTSNYSQTFTFNNPIIPTTTTNAIVNGTMLEKNISLTVNNVAYTNVIKFKIVQNVTVQGQVSTVTSNYWFAKGVGCIKVITQSAGSPDTTMELISYTLN